MTDSLPPVVRHFATATYVVAPAGKWPDGRPRVLMLKHKKIPSWLPPGGHYEENELPHESALRELREETGIKAEVGEVSELDGKRNLLLPSPHHIQLEHIGENHFHIDMVFFAKAKTVEIDNQENHEIKWMTREELSSLGGIYEEARRWGLEALEQLGKEREMEKGQ